MSERSILPSVGTLIYVILSAIDRFIYTVPDYIYIPVAIIAIVIVIGGIIKNKIK